MQERLQKIVAQAGYGSRRVDVAGKRAGLGQKAGPAVDTITIEGKALAASESLTYLALYKPPNVLSTVGKEKGDDRKSVRDLVDLPGHLYPVGRWILRAKGWCC